MQPNIQPFTSCKHTTCCSAGWVVSCKRGLTSCCRQLATAGVSDGVVRGATSTAAAERHRRRSQKAAQLDATAVQADAPAPGPGGDRREGLPERGQIDHRRRRRRRVDAERQQRPADPPLRDDHRQQRAAVILTRRRPRPPARLPREPLRMAD